MFPNCSRLFINAPYSKTWFFFLFTNLNQNRKYFTLVLLFSSLYLYQYPSIHSISRLAGQKMWSHAQTLQTSKNEFQNIKSDYIEDNSLNFLKPNGFIGWSIFIWRMKRNRFFNLSWELFVGDLWELVLVYEIDWEILDLELVISNIKSNAFIYSKRPKKFRRRKIKLRKMYLSLITWQNQHLRLKLIFNHSRKLF